LVVGEEEGRRGRGMISVLLTGGELGCEYIQNPTQRDTCQKSVNPTHSGKPARRSGNPTHSAASDTVFRKSDTIPGNPTHRSAIVAWQWMLLLLI
jgi:hypothetical protein